jgi:hypothetical protein
VIRNDPVPPSDAAVRNPIVGVAEVTVRVHDTFCHTPIVGVTAGPEMTPVSAKEVEPGVVCVDSKYTHAEMVYCVPVVKVGVSETPGLLGVTPV